MALSDVLYHLDADLRRYTEDEFYQEMYGEKTIERARRIIDLCDKLRKELDAPPATESQRESDVAMSITE